MVTHIVPIGFHSKHLYSPIKKYGGDKIILLLSQNKDSASKTKVNDAIKQAKKIAEMLQIEVKEVKFKIDYDIQERLAKLDNIFKNEKRVVVNITGGPKFDGYLLYLMALKYRDKVVDIVYIRDDIEEMMSFPKAIICESLTSFERDLLKALKEKGPISPKDLAKELNKPYTQVLRYISGLEEKGYIASDKTEGTRKISLKFKLLV